MQADNLLTEWKIATDVPRWALRYYLRNATWIVGLSLIPAVTRFVQLYVRPEWPDSFPLLLEVVVTVIRIALLWLIIQGAIIRDPHLSRVNVTEKRERFRAFWRHRWPSLVIQLVLMSSATLLFDIIPEQVIGPHVPPSHHQLYFALLLTVKNPTVIAWFMVWMVGVIRQGMYYPRTASHIGQRISL